MTNAAFDPHATLGLRPGADATQVREAYRRLARAHHPDRSGDPRATERMQAINRAWTILSDPADRRSSGPRAAGRGTDAHRPWPPPSGATARRSSWSGGGAPSWSAGATPSWSAGRAAAPPYGSTGSSVADDLSGPGVLVAIVLLVTIGPLVFGILPFPLLGLFVLLALVALARGVTR